MAKGFLILHLLNSSFNVINFITMTPQECKDYNDLHIRQKTDELSISTDEVATAIDNVCDLPLQFGLNDNQGAENRTYNMNAFPFVFKGGQLSVHEAGGVNGVNIISPIGPGFQQAIAIDQPNGRIQFVMRNADSGGGIQRSNNARTIIYANNSDADTPKVDLVINGTVKASIEAAGFAGAFKSKSGTPTGTEIPAGFFAVVKNTADDTYSVWVNDGGTLIEVVGGDGASVIDESFHTLTDGATITVDYNVGRNFKLASIAGNRTIAVSNVVEGREIKIKVPQDATGGWTITMPAGTKIPHGQATGLTFNNSAGGSQIDYIVMWHDGDNLNASALFNMHS